jgi:hypothetical protein
MGTSPGGSNKPILRLTLHLPRGPFPVFLVACHGRGRSLVRNRRESIVGRALPGPINSNFHELPRGRATRPKTGQHLGDGPRIHPRLPKASQEVVKLSIRSLAKIFDFVLVVLTQKGGDFREG